MVFSGVTQRWTKTGNATCDVAWKLAVLGERSEVEVANSGPAGPRFSVWSRNATRVERAVSVFQLSWSLTKNGNNDFFKSED